MYVFNIESLNRITCHKIRTSPGTNIENGEQTFNPDQLDEIVLDKC